MKLPSIRRRSTDSIVGPLAKIVKNLEGHAAQQSLASDNKADRATRLLREVQDHDAEARRALAARDKIASLIG